DAVALIAHQSFKDSTVALADVVAFMKGARTSSTIKGLVFDNPNSSTMRLLNERATSTISEQDDIYSFQTSEQVIEFIADNAGMIGIVGMNWLTQPSKESATVLENVKILSVKDINGDRYIYPSQNNLAEGTYPLA